MSDAPGRYPNHDLRRRACHHSKPRPVMWSSDLLNALIPVRRGPEHLAVHAVLLHSHSLCVASALHQRAAAHKFPVYPCSFMSQYARTLAQSPARADPHTQAQRAPVDPFAAERGPVDCAADALVRRGRRNDAWLADHPRRTRFREVALCARRVVRAPVVREPGRAEGGGCRLRGRVIFIQREMWKWMYV
jgi:hypothetical protein